MTGLTAEYILRHDSKPAHCHTGPRADRLAELDRLGYAFEYAERGYTQPRTGILFANWNYFSKEAADLLERAGYDIEWSDEWDICSDCGKAVRTSPDCYGWQPYYVVVSGDTVCLNCVDWPDYLERCEDKVYSSVPSACNPAEHGYRLLSEAGQYETGLHAHQTDKPAEILAKCKAAGQTRVVFRIAGKGQFDISWEVWQWIGTPSERLANIKDAITYLHVSTNDDEDMLWHGRRNALAIIESIQASL